MGWSWLAGIREMCRHSKIIFQSLGCREIAIALAKGRLVALRKLQVHFRKQLGLNNIYPMSMAREQESRRASNRAAG